MIKYPNILLFLFLYSCNLFGQDTVYLDSDWKPTTKSNCSFYRIDKKEGVKWLRTDYYKSGQIQMRGYVTSRDPEVKTGYFEWFFANGKLKHKGNFVDDKEIGEHLWYSDNGNTDAVENYKNGKLDGEYKEYYKSTGKLYVATAFVNGLQSGYTKYYREDGMLHSEGDFKDGDRTGSWKFYDESGKFIGTNEYKTEYVLPEANLYLKLPNSSWELTSKDTGAVTEYIFKREPVTDSLDREIIPGIMVYIEDATRYKQDVTVYAIDKQRPFMQNGAKVDEITIHESPDYPVSYKNSYLYKCHYADKGLDHILYMIFIITEENKGIQIFMDMTKDIAGEYEQEFLQTMRSIKENVN